MRARGSTDLRSESGRTQCAPQGRENASAFSRQSRRLTKPKTKPPRGAFLLVGRWCADESPRFDRFAQRIGPHAVRPAGARKRISVFEAIPPPDQIQDQPARGAGTRSLTSQMFVGPAPIFISEVTGLAIRLQGLRRIAIRIGAVIVNERDAETASAAPPLTSHFVVLQ